MDKYDEQADTIADCVLLRTGTLHPRLSKQIAAALREQGQEIELLKDDAFELWQDNKRLNIVLADLRTELDTELDKAQANLKDLDEALTGAIKDRDYFSDLFDQSNAAVAKYNARMEKVQRIEPAPTTPEAGLRALATWFDQVYADDSDMALQNDLRRWADELIDLRAENDNLKHELLTIGDMAVVDFDDTVVGVVDKAVPNPPATYAQRRKAELEQHQALRAELAKAKAKGTRLEGLEMAARYVETSRLAREYSDKSHYAKQMAMEIRALIDAEKAKERGDG